MDLGQLLKNGNLLGALFHTQAAGYTLRRIGFPQFLILFDRIEPGSLALEMIINREDLRDGDALRADTAVITAGAGNQRLLA